MRSILTSKPVGSKSQKSIALLFFCCGFSSILCAAPNIISTISGTPITYSFFTVDTGKLAGRTVTAVQNELQQQLISNNTGLTACWVLGDLNVTNINCANGEIRFGSSEAYTYNLETALAGVPFAFDRAIGEAQITNFITPNGVIPGDAKGRVVRLHFKQKIAQFGMKVDPGIVPNVTGVQFIVNNQSTPVQSFTAGVVQFVGVEDKSGFNDLTILASGGNRSWIADQFSILPLANF